MTDRELLTLAAKAIGRLLPHGNPALIRPNEELHCDGGEYWFWPAGDSWNPLTDDGDALRLAVKLDLIGHPRFFHERDVLMFTQNTPKLQATRCAIVRAAAEIGKTMQ